MQKVVLMLAMVFFSQCSLADAAGEIKYRQGVMGVVGGHMSSMVAIMRGRVHQADLKLHARGMANIAEVVPSVFPKGSGDGKTGALPAIWKNPEAFQSAMDEFVEAAKEINQVMESKNMERLGPTLKKLGGACKGCHDDFRKEHDH
ncbi:MAG: cytochrome c [bacterium]|nr:cytochrome c [Gammaproteobacteria bacterium]HIL95529.1 cytochrome c [Pseudomonadales bacterium]